MTIVSISLPDFIANSVFSGCLWICTSLSSPGAASVNKKTCLNLLASLFISIILVAIWLFSWAMFSLPSDLLGSTCYQPFPAPTGSLIYSSVISRGFPCPRFSLKNADLLNPTSE